ncbi:hypothetical protein GGI07_003660 [Coemansia sp. Benny D115]|nr:hypothetical protein GGI07_003660 [Coemansia sp. Benny D115]
MSSSRLAESSSSDNAVVAQGVFLATKEVSHERRSDHGLWLLNHLHVPLTFHELVNSHYDIVDIVANTSAHSGGGGSGAGGSSRHTHSLVNSHHRNSPHRTDKQQQQHYHHHQQQHQSMLFSPSVYDTSLLTENLDRKFKFTEETTFWTVHQLYNIIFVIDMSQSMYSLDPNTNEAHIHTALETLEKCLAGMVQKFVVRSTLGLPDYDIAPNICASIVGYCPRLPGSYPTERDRKKLPFCRTLAHARMVTAESIPDIMRSVRNFLFNYEGEIQDSLGSFPPPPPPIPPEPAAGTDAQQQHKQFDSFPKQRGRRAGKSGRYASQSATTSLNVDTFENAKKSNRQPKAGDTFTFTYDPDAPLLHTLQIADYFLKIMPEVCSPAFVYLTDGVMRSNFATSKAQSLTSSLSRHNTQCTFIQVGSCGGFTPETSLGYVGDNELLLCLAASLDGRFIYASDCPDTVPLERINFYHQVMLIREAKLARTLVRHRYDSVFQGGRRLGDMPRERLNTKKTGSRQLTQRGDIGFPWCADSKPPIVDTVTTRYSDYKIPVSINLLMEARMNEGFIVRNIQISKLDRDGLAERINIKMELVWHSNITIVYRITNTQYFGPGDPRDEPSGRSNSSTNLASRARSDSASSDEDDLTIKDRGQRCPNMIDISIQSYNMFTLVFLMTTPSDGRKSEIFSKVAMLHQFLKTMADKDDRLRQMNSIPSDSLAPHPRSRPRVFIPPVLDNSASPPRAAEEITPSTSRIFSDEVDPNVFIDYAEWGTQQHYIYDMLLQMSKNGDALRPLASFRHTASMFIDSELILSFVGGINFTETAKQGRRIMSDFRAHVCQAGTWALLKDEDVSVVFLRDEFRLSHRLPAFIVARWVMATNWILRVNFCLFNGTIDARRVVTGCLPTFSESFSPEYRDRGRESVARATRPLHLLPLDLDIVDPMAPNLLSTQDMGDMHTYVVEWRWTYLAREDTREDLSGEGLDREIVRQALHRLALTLAHYRLTQDFTLVNAKGESTGLVSGPGASKYDCCLTFYHEREGYDLEGLLLACQYQIIVDMKQSSVTARTWLEPWSARFLRSMFEDDFRTLAPLGTFQQILQPERCFQLKVPNIAEFHSKRMNMFSIMAVVNSSRLALRVVQLPDITPAYAVWNQPNGANSIKLDDPTFPITPDPDPDEDLQIQIIDESGNVVETHKASDYYKTHDRDETQRLVNEKKIRIKHVGTSQGERRAILLERFMLTLFDKSEGGRYDPYIEKYRLNEYNPFILALINPGHPRKLFFNKLAAQWMTTGEFTMVAYRCFLEFSLFSHCDAISVNAERFNKLRFASSIVSELSANSPGLHLATGVPNALDEHLFVDKWFVIRLPNNTSFLMVIFPNVSFAAPRRDRGGQADTLGLGDQTGASTTDTAESRNSHRRSDSQPASPPVFTPALESSITGGMSPGSNGLTAINSYTLVMECSMDNGELRSNARTKDMAAGIVKRSQLNLCPLEVGDADTRVPGDTFQGFVGQKLVPIPFTEYAVAEIKRLERMYAEAQLQTIYLALLLKRQVSAADLVFSQKSPLWRRRSIDVDITAFLHSQDAARFSREAEWQAQDRQNLQERFSGLLAESFTELPGETPEDKLYYCRPTPDTRSELEVCLQLAQNPLFVNFKCSIEVLDKDLGYVRRLNMSMERLPLSLEQLCEQAGLPWRPPTDHFEPSMKVRVILHINCLYLPEAADAKGTGEAEKAEDADETETKEPGSLDATVLPGPADSKHEAECYSITAFQETMALPSLIRSNVGQTLPVEKLTKSTFEQSGDSLPSSLVAKRHTSAQIATLKGLPQDQLQLVRHFHRKLGRLVAQETLYALRDINPVTGPLLKQVWHTIATTVDDEDMADKFEFAHNRFDLPFLGTNFDPGRRRHAMELITAELLRPDGAPAWFPLGKLHQLDGLVYMRDTRSRSSRIEARARLRSGGQGSGQSRTGHRDGAAPALDSANFADSIPSWFVIRPTRALDGVRILAHNYSTITDEAAESALAATHQLLMAALKAVNTRLLLEEMAELHSFPSQLTLPKAAGASSMVSTSGTRLGHHHAHTESQAVRDEAPPPFGSSPSAASLATAERQRNTGGTQANTPISGQAHNAAVDRPLAGAGASTPHIASAPKKPAAEASNLYTCDEQFRHTFPLHPRISPQRAIQAVLVSGMMNSRLSNQPNMFFVRDGASLFYALLTIGRIPYVSPFGSSSGGNTGGPAAIQGSGLWTGNSHSISAAPSPGPGTIPVSDAAGTGAHTVATTSPDPSGFASHVDGPSLLQTTAGGISLRRRSPMVPPVNTSSIFTLSALTSADSTGPSGIDLHMPPSPRVSVSRIEPAIKSAGVTDGDAGRFGGADGSAQKTTLSATPESPSGRYLLSSLTNLDHQQLRGYTHHLRSVHESHAFANDDEQGPSTDPRHQLPHTTSIVSMPTFDSQPFADAAPIATAEEKTQPCIVLHVYGVDKPSKGLTQGLVQQIGECITVHVTMPQMSDMLYRQVALNEHDLDFLFPMCNPEPTVVYLPLPRFVHDLDRLLLHFKQTMGEIIPQFPSSYLLAKAIRRSYMHLRKFGVDHGDIDDEESEDNSVVIGTRVPDTLRKDFSRILEGWEYDRQTSRRLPVERLVFLYNYFTRAGAPLPEMSSIGSGIAIVSALPLTPSRTIAKGIWADALSQNVPANATAFSSTLGIGTSHRFEAPVVHVSAADFPGPTDAATAAERLPNNMSQHRRVSSCVNPDMPPVTKGGAAASNQQFTTESGPATLEQRSSFLMHRRASHTPSPRERGLNSSTLPSPSVDTSSSGTSAHVEAAEDNRERAIPETRSLPVSELATLFGEYLSQFKRARERMRFEAADFEELNNLMERQVSTFAGEPVLAITLWSNTDVRIDRLLAFVSRAYWNSLGDYVSEQVLYPILSAGWGNRPNQKIRLPDPYVDIEHCTVYPNEPGTCRQSPADVEVKLDAEWGSGLSFEPVHQALLRTRDIQLPSGPSTFTEGTKKQIHAMEVARQMAQYWGNQDTVKSLRHHRQQLPRVTGISHYFSEELRGVLETMCPAMNPGLYRLLENPMVLHSNNDSSSQNTPTSLFPALSLRKPSERKSTNVVYDVSALPTVLRGTRQSFFIMCTLPLEATGTPALSLQMTQTPLQIGGGPSGLRNQYHSSNQQHSNSASGTASGPHGGSSSAAVNVGTIQGRRLESLKRAFGVSDPNVNLHGQRYANRTSAGLAAAVQGSGTMHGLGLQGLLPGDSQPYHLHRQQQLGPHPNRQYAYPSGSGGGSGKATAEAYYSGRRSHKLPPISERNVQQPQAKKILPPSDYKPVADPEIPVLGVEEIAYYSPQSRAAGASTKAWLTIWLVGGELEMVGYNVSQRLWDGICDQIRQRLEREGRRKQLLGMFASHMFGIFPGYDQKARHEGISSTWLDRDVTRDLINKFALLKQLTYDDQIHYFNIERMLSPDYMKLLGLYDGSPELNELMTNPPVAEMTLNDMNTELVLRQLQPDHLRWARKLAYVDYTQPYVDTNHPDTLFRMGTRFLRAYQGRIAHVLRYDELMKIAERWRQLIQTNNLHDTMYRSSRMVMLDLQTNGTHSFSGGENTVSQSTSNHSTGTRSEPTLPLHHALPADEQRKVSFSSSPANASKAIGKMPANATSNATRTDASKPLAEEKPDEESEMSLEDIELIMENARLLHYVCAPLPISNSIKPAGTDLRAFKRLFFVVSAMLQNLADSYINYLCSTGYIVARRFEKTLPWKASLASLGYSPDKVSEFTRTFLGQSHQYFVDRQNLSMDAEAALPGIQVPSAYLFGSTERTNLVTDIEVSPGMLSIHMHALSRFTSEWRSAVPGYVRSSINPRSIKKFTFELSRYKKLLHAKSFVYDFQLRYVASMLKPLATTPLDSGVDHDLNLPDLHVHDCYEHAIYSSESDASVQSGDSLDDDYSGDSEAEEYSSAWVTTKPAGAGIDESVGGFEQDGRQGDPRCKHRTFAQALHVHIDLTIFLAELSEQRYFSTRFSSRRLVRAKFPMMYRDIYEYFLTHSEKYQFYTEGCRPPRGKDSVFGMPPSPSSKSVPIVDLCSKSASHSGCYRLYEGVLPDSMHMQYEAMFGNSEASSYVGSYPWATNHGEFSPANRANPMGAGMRPAAGRNSDLKASSMGRVAPSSAPEAARRASNVGDGSLESLGKLHAYPMAFNGQNRGARHYSGIENGLAQRTPNYGGGNAGASGASIAVRNNVQIKKPVAMSYVPGMQLNERFAAMVGQRSTVDEHASNKPYAVNSQPEPLLHRKLETPMPNSEPSLMLNAMHPQLLSSSPHAAGSIKSVASRPARHNAKGFHDLGISDVHSSVQRSGDYAMSEYSANKIRLTSNESFVRVSLMALTPDCDSCRIENARELRRSRDRQHNHDHAKKLKKQARGDGAGEHARHRKHKHRQHRHKHRDGVDSEGKSVRTLDDIGELFGSLRRKHVLREKGFDHHSPMHRAAANHSNANSFSASGGSRQFQQSHHHGHTNQQHQIPNPYQKSQRQAPLSFDKPRYNIHDSRNATPLRQWMASLSSDITTDAQADGLRTNDSNTSAALESLPVDAPEESCMAQLSYYLVIDMDPQTTISLNNLKADDAQGRNGSLGPIPACGAGGADNGSISELYSRGLRTCKACQMQPRHSTQPMMCGIHRVLDAVHVDMRDWENKGDVWANEPTMVMEVSAIDPDEYNKEDPDVLSWIRKTARRLIRQTVIDYHRDINWYRTYQHLRMADLPSDLSPVDICELVGFIERRGWVDVGETDEAAQQLISLGMTAQRVIEALQLRLRKLYLEPALLITSLLAGHSEASTRPMVIPQLVTDDNGPWSNNSSHRRVTAALGELPPNNALRRSALSAASFVAGGTPPEIPNSQDHAPFGLSRYPSIDRSAEYHHGNNMASDSAISAAAGRSDVLTAPICPVVTIDSNGRIVPGLSSANINDLLSLFFPLETKPNRKLLLDPTFQKVLSRFVRIDIVASPWLCGCHRFTQSLPSYTWTLEDVPVPSVQNSYSRDAADAAIGAATRGYSTLPRFVPDDGVMRSTNKRVQQVQEIEIGPANTSMAPRIHGQRRRTDASASSVGIMESLASSMQLAHGLSGVGADSAASALGAQQATKGQRKHDVHASQTAAASSSMASATAAATASNNGGGFGSQAGGIGGATNTTLSSADGQYGATGSSSSNGGGTTGVGYPGLGQTGVPFTDRFSKSCVEVSPGTLVVIDPEDSQYVARMFVLNPFSYNSMLELTFVRSVERGEAVLSQLRAISRDRQRDGLYEYERKHINMVLSTISAVIWDMMTEPDSIFD